MRLTQFFKLHSDYRTMKNRQQQAKAQVILVVTRRFRVRTKYLNLARRQFYCPLLD